MNSEPPREELLTRLEDASKLLVDSFVKNIELTLRTCVSCEHFDDAKEECGLNRMRPPARIIAFGCECYEQRIPF